MTEHRNVALDVVLGALLNPRSVAVIGASGSSLFSRRLLNNLDRHGYSGKIFLVNPRRANVAGRSCYPTIGAVPGDVDLAIVMVGSEHVVAALAECAAAGVAVAAVAASGFAEAGAQGRARQEAVAALARDTGMRILGPNCMGVIVQKTGLVATFSQAADIDLLPGSGAAYVGQSGAIGGAVLGLCRQRGFGLSAWCTAGNEVDLTSVDVARGLLERPDISTVALYLESVPHGAQWRDLLDAAEQRGKQLVLLRSGRSQAGQRAAASHTGAMVRADAAFDLLNRQRGVITVDEVAALIDVLEALRYERCRPGTRLGVVTSSGGLGTMMADSIEIAGLYLSELSEHTRRDIAGLIPDFGSTENPIDVTAQLFNGDGEGFEHVCASVLSDPAVDTLAICLTTIVGEAATTLARSIARAVGPSRKYAFVVWVAPEDQTGDARNVLRAAGIPAATAIGPRLDLVRHLNAGAAEPGITRPQISRSARAAEAHGILVGRTGTLTESDGALFLDALGIRRPRGRLAVSPEDAADAAAQLADLDAAVVMKIQSPDIVHKSDVGGVAIGVAIDDAKPTYAQLVETAMQRTDNIQGVLVQEMAAPGHELILSVSSSDDGYPPVVTVGFGGVTAELMRDLVSGLAPLDPAAALAMLKQLRGWPLLNGFRGASASDVAGIVDAMCALSEFSVYAAEILVEVEINPLRVGSDTTVALDLLVSLATTSALA